MSESYFTLRAACRSCGSDNFQPVYAVEPIPVAGIYYDAVADPVCVSAPMTVVGCQGCGLVQLRETISPTIYRDYSFVGNSAAAYQEHLQGVAATLVQDWGMRGRRIFEVGASNGVLLGFLAELGGNEVSGIEPSGKLCDEAVKSGIDVRQGYFDRSYLERSHPGTFDCVVIRHVLEHIDDLNDMVGSMKGLLGKDGLLVAEVPNVEQIIQGNLLSNIFHEHLNYFSLQSLNHLMSRHGLGLVEQREVDVHGGSLLLFYRPGTNPPAPPRLDLDRLRQFSARAQAYYRAIHDRITALTRAGKTVHGYGASHRTFILLGNSGLGRDEVPVIYDNNPFLHNKRLNGFHALVQPKEAITANSPDVVVIFATSYEREITSFLLGECGYRGEIISLSYEAICGKG
jgi:SAM-dependent methyltransferase